LFQNNTANVKWGKSNIVLLFFLYHNVYSIIFRHKVLKFSYLKMRDTRNNTGKFKDIQQAIIKLLDGYFIFFDYKIAASTPATIANNNPHCVPFAGTAAALVVFVEEGTVTLTRVKFDEVAELCPTTEADLLVEFTV
jgi:hypothetical protein